MFERLEAVTALMFTSILTNTASQLASRRFSVNAHYRPSPLAYSALTDSLFSNGSPSQNTTGCLAATDLEEMRPFSCFLASSHEPETMVVLNL
jgi:hypothetical protein